MTKENTRLQYIKNVLGIKSVIIPKDYVAKISTDSAAEFSFQTFNEGAVLFLSHFKKDEDKNFSVEELQLLEKIIVALKLKFEKTDIAKVKVSTKERLVADLKSKKYSYIFLMGKEISDLFAQKNEFEENGVKFFATYHPQDMIKNPDLKKEAWFGFKNIMENLPR
jgi:hypothetical protein